MTDKFLSFWSALFSVLIVLATQAEKFNVSIPNDVLQYSLVGLGILGLLLLLVLYLFGIHPFDIETDPYTINFFKS